MLTITKYVLFRFFSRYKYSWILLFLVYLEKFEFFISVKIFIFFLNKKGSFKDNLKKKRKFEERKKDFKK